MPSGVEAERMQTPNSVLATEQVVVDAQPASKKQKQGEAAEPGAAKPPRSFKAIATLVIAMKRFQGGGLLYFGYIFHS